MVQTKLLSYWGIEGIDGVAGENIPAYGALIETKDLVNVVRIAFQNVNGLKLGNERAGAAELDAMNQLGIDIMGMAETNLSWTREKKLQLAALAKIAFDGTSRCIASSTTSNKEGYLPGGTAMITRGPVSGRVQAQGADPFGRFTWMALRGREDSGVLIITAYRVGQRKGVKAGPTTAYSQQWVEMRKKGIENPDPRNSILEDISTLIYEWGEKGFHPLVMLDANATQDERQFSDFIDRDMTSRILYLKLMKGFHHQRMNEGPRK